MEKWWWWNALEASCRLLHLTLLRMWRMRGDGDFFYKFLGHASNSSIG